MKLEKNIIQAIKFSVAGSVFFLILYFLSRSTFYLAYILVHFLSLFTIFQAYLVVPCSIFQRVGGYGIDILIIVKVFTSFFIYYFILSVINSKLKKRSDKIKETLKAKWPLIVFYIISWAIAMIIIAGRCTFT